MTRRPTLPAASLLAVTTAALVLGSAANAKTTTTAVPRAGQPCHAADASRTLPGLRCTRQGTRWTWTRTTATSTPATNPKPNPKPAAPAPATTGTTGTAGTTAAARPAPKRGGKMVFGVQTGDPGGFTPSQSTLGSGPAMIRWTMIETVTQPDVDGNIHCYLCESIKPNSSYTEWTIKLRPGITFHDGTALDAAALKVNLDDGRRAGSATSATLRQITSVEVVDPLTVLVKVDAPWVSFPANLTQQAGAIVAPSQIRDPDGRRKPVGTGPFKFKEWVPNDHITVVRYDNYWRKGLPYLDEITFRPVPDEAPRITALQAGDLDGISASTGSTVATLRDLDAAGKVRLTELTRFPAVNLIVLNNQAGPAADFRVRKAIQLATDRTVFNKVVNAGTASLAEAPFGNKGDVSVQNVWPKPDPGRAKELIDEVVKSTGRPVEITLTVTQGADSIAQAELLQTMWKAAGITMKVAVSEGGGNANIVQRGQFQAMILGPIASSVDPDEMRRYFYSDPQPIGTPSGNWPHISDAIIDSAFDQLRGNSDPAVQVRAANAITRAIADQAYVIFTTLGQAAVATSPKFALEPAVLPDGAPWWLAPTGPVALQYASRV